MTPWLVLSVIVGALALVGVVAVAAVGRRGRDGREGSGRTRDEHGRVVKLVDPTMLQLRGRDDVIDRATLDAIVQQLDPGALRGRWPLYVATGTAAVVVLGLGLMVVVEGAPAWADIVGTLTNPAILVCLVGGSIAPWIAARRQRMGRVRAVLLNHGRCPHCGYGLTGVPAGDDALTTCPECACAWRIDARACVDPGPVPAAHTGKVLVLLALGVASFLAGLAAYFFVK